MAEKDKALVSILERLAAEMTHQDKMLTDLLERQGDLAKTVEASVLHLRGNQADTGRSYDKLLESISKYRSDMLSLVNEQDHINKNIDELHKALKAKTYTMDVTNQRLVEMDERLSRHDKSTNDYIEYAYKQPGIYIKALNDSAQDFARLHSATEKNLAQFQRETVRQLEKFQSETKQRLLLLDSIVISLQTLLVRTEPPVKKRSWIVRLFIRVRGFLNRNIRLRFTRKPK